MYNDSNERYPPWYPPIFNGVYNMAIDLKDFSVTKYPNLFKSRVKHKINGYKYLMWMKIDGKLHKKIIGYSETDKLTDTQANTKMGKIRIDIEAGYTPTNKIDLNKLFDLFAEDFDVTKRWTVDRIAIYNRYVRNNTTGKKQISKIQERDIKSIVTGMIKKGLSPRTQKSVLEVLKPLFKFALKNKYLKEDPLSDYRISVPSQKKPVVNATELFKKVYQGIMTYYADNPFYKSLFLFGFAGRRKSEILNIKWENINLNKNYYWIIKTKSQDNQQYELPLFIKEHILQINDDRKGFVFKSPVTGEALVDISRQMNHLKKHTGIKNLTLHYMRNILVSALAEEKTEAVVLSGILGHKDTNIINQYLSLNYYKSSQEGFVKIDKIIDVKVT
jgi:integrase